MQWFRLCCSWNGRSKLLIVTVTLVPYIFDFWVVQSAGWHCDSNKWRTNFATTGTLSTTDLQPVRAGRLQFKKQTNSNEIRAGKLEHLSQTNTNIKLRCKWYPESANGRLGTLDSEASQALCFSPQARTVAQPIYNTYKAEIQGPLNSNVKLQQLMTECIISRLREENFKHLREATQRANEPHPQHPIGLKILTVSEHDCRYRIAGSEIWINIKYVKVTDWGLCNKFADRQEEWRQKCRIDSLQVVRRIGQPATWLCCPLPMEYQSAATGNHQK